MLILQTRILKNEKKILSEGVIRYFKTGDCLFTTNGRLFKQADVCFNRDSDYLNQTILSKSAAVAICMLYFQDCQVLQFNGSDLAYPVYQLFSS